MAKYILEKLPSPYYQYPLLRPLKWPSSPVSNPISIDSYSVKCASRYMYVLSPYSGKTTISSWNPLPIKRDGWKAVPSAVVKETWRKKKRRSPGAADAVSSRNWVRHCARPWSYVKPRRTVNSEDFFKDSIFIKNMI